MLTAQLCSSSHTTQDSKSENCVTHPVLSLPISITRVKKFFIDPPDLDHTSLRLSTQVILDCINLPTENITDCIWPGNMAIFTKWGNLEKKLRTENINYPVLFLSTWEIKDCTDYVWRQYSCEYFPKYINKHCITMWRKCLSKVSGIIIFSELRRITQLNNYPTLNKWKAKIYARGLILNGC